MFMGVVSFFLVVLVYFIFYLMSFSSILDCETMSVYECGFEMGSGNRLVFSYRFFLIAVLFLIFDVEIVLMLPLPMMNSGIFFLIFVGILIMGLIYEFFCGSLEWL